MWLLKKHTGKHWGNMWGRIHWGHISVKKHYIRYSEINVSGIERQIKRERKNRQNQDQMNVICWFSTYWPFSPSLVLLHKSSASLMNVFLVISDQGGSPQTFPAQTLSPCQNFLFLSPPFFAHTNLTVHGYLVDCMYMCDCVWFLWKGGAYNNVFM